MTPSQLRKRIGNYRFSVLLIMLMLAMLFFGYQLATYRHTHNTLALKNAKQTATLLERENNQLHKRQSQLEVDLMLEKGKVMAAQQQHQDAVMALRRQEEQLAFYQNVMAPELTQDGFLVDGLQVVAAASAGFYQLSMVLLQQRQNKAIVKGDLFIRIVGSRAGKPWAIEPGLATFLPEGPVAFRFKYFQTVDVTFELPKDFTPEFVELSAEVYQYTTKRGDYDRRLPWNEVYEQQREPADTGQ